MIQITGKMLHIGLNNRLTPSIQYIYTCKYKYNLVVLAFDAKIRYFLARFYSTACPSSLN